MSRNDTLVWRDPEGRVEVRDADGSLTIVRIADGMELGKFQAGQRSDQPIYKEAHDAAIARARDLVAKGHA